jgi:hypothetical protein
MNFKKIETSSAIGHKIILECSRYRANGSRWDLFVYENITERKVCVLSRTDKAAIREFILKM